MPEDRLSRGPTARSGTTTGARPGRLKGGSFHRAEALAESLPPLLVAAQRVAATVSQGVHGRRRVGQGETFWQFRRYEPGDSTVRIDWRKSAKSQQVFIRQTEWEAAQSVWLWRDSSPSMGYRSSEAVPTKKERAEILLLALASLLTRGGEHLALLGDGRSPTPGRAALRRIAESIESGRYETASLPSIEPLPRYGHVVLFGDFLAPLAEIKPIVSAYASGGVRGHLVQVVDPVEETLPFTGRIRFEGMENDGELLVGRVETVRTDYVNAVAAHMQGLKELATSAGWGHIVHHTHRPPHTALLLLFLALSGARR